MSNIFALTGLIGIFYIYVKVNSLKRVKRREGEEKGEEKEWKYRIEEGREERI